MNPSDVINASKSDLLDRILRSVPPHAWMHETDGMYVFNEVTVIARFHQFDNNTASTEVEILEFNG